MSWLFYLWKIFTSSTWLLFEAVLVQSSCICWNFKMYLSKTQNVFCLKFNLYLSKFWEEKNIYLFYIITLWGWAGNPPSKVVERDTCLQSQRLKASETHSELLHEIFPLKLDWAFTNGLQGHHQTSRHKVITKSTWDWFLLVNRDLFWFWLVFILMHILVWSLLFWLVAFISLHILGSRIHIKYKTHTFYKHLQMLSSWLTPDSYTTSTKSFT